MAKGTIYNTDFLYFDKSILYMYLKDVEGRNMSYDTKVFNTKHLHFYEPQDAIKDVGNCPTFHLDRRSGTVYTKFT